MILLSLVLSVAAFVDRVTRRRAPRSSEAPMGTEYLAVSFTDSVHDHQRAARRLHVSGLHRTADADRFRRSSRSSGSCCGSSAPSERAAGLEALFALTADLERRHVARHLDGRDAAAVPAADGHRQHGNRRSRPISSFVTNTNLQHYSGETGLSYLSQMFVITFLQFVTAATGVAAAVAMIRGLAGNRLQQLGNFYVDLTRDGPRFLPLALLVSAPTTGRGRRRRSSRRRRRRPSKARSRRSRGVTAGVVSIKQLGTNGGGYFGPNSTHPYENPTPLSNFIETLSITVIPMSMVVMLGLMTGRKSRSRHLRDDVAIYPPMVVFGVSGRSTRRLPGWASTNHRVDGRQGSPLRAGLSALWAVTTTVTSNGSTRCTIR